MSDPRFDLPDLNAEQMGVVAGLTERQVKDRVAKGQFVCHWTGGTLKNPRGMRFSPEEVAHNRGVNTSPLANTPPPAFSDAKVRKGVARLSKARAAAESPHSSAA